MATKRYSTMPATIEFEGVEIRIVDRQGRPWITLDDLARALYGIKGGDTSVTPLRAIRRLLDKNRDEFADDMTAILTMETAGGPQQARIFSPRGCHLMGMLARTDAAKRFRRWVLDVLEGKVTIAGEAAEQRRFNNEMRERRMRVIEARQRLAERAAHVKAVNETRLTEGRRAASALIPGLLAAFGVDPDTAQSEPQGELPLDDTVH